MRFKIKDEVFKALCFLFGVGIIVISYYIGELLSTLMARFISPAVIGMIVLFALLKSKIIKPIWVESASNFLLDNLMLFFIPATAGVALVPLTTLKEQAPAILTSVIISSFLVLWIVGYIADRFEVKKSKSQ